MAFPTEKVVLVCGRVDDPYCRHSSDSTQFSCCDCGYAVMADPTTTKTHRESGSPIVCVECFARHRDAGNKVILIRSNGNAVK